MILGGGQAGRPLKELVIRVVSCDPSRTECHDLEGPMYLEHATISTKNRQSVCFHEADEAPTRHTGSYNLRPRHIAGCNERGIGGEEVEMRVAQKKSE